MSFSSDAKSELSRLEPVCDLCDIAEISAMMHASGSLAITHEGVGITFQTENATVARRNFTLLKRTFGVTAQIRTLRKKKFNRNYVYQTLLSGEGAQAVIERAELLSRKEEGVRLNKRVPGALTRRKCCARAYLRGTFLSCGTLSDPERGYHMEFAFASQQYAESIVKLINKLGFHAKAIRRKETFVVYLKESAQISDLLGSMGATNALLKIENIRVEKQLSNDINRTINCEYANMEKRLLAAKKHLEAIDVIDRWGDWSGLSGQTRQIAEVRRENPDATLAELGEFVSPQLSKSAVNNHLRKLIKHAQELESDH